MPGLIGLCIKYYDTKDLYEVLEIKKGASAKEIKKAYHRLSLKVHPDRVNEDEKLEATEKFKVLGKVHSILSDREKKVTYDETGSFDEEDELSERNWTEYWRMIFKPITEQDIVNYEKNYKGSELEKKDLKRAYLEGKGDIDFIMELTPFSRVDEEPRLLAIIQEMIDSNEVPEYKIFTNEPKRKMQQRHKRAAKEALEVERLNKMIEIEKSEKENDLAMMIQKRQEERSSQMDSFFDKLAEKYGNKSSTKSKKRPADTPTKQSTNKKRKQ